MNTNMWFFLSFTQKVDLFFGVNRFICFLESFLLLPVSSKDLFWWRFSGHEICRSECWECVICRTPGVTSQDREKQKWNENILQRYFLYYSILMRLLKSVCCFQNWYLRVGTLNPDACKICGHQFLFYLVCLEIISNLICYVTGNSRPIYSSPSFRNMNKCLVGNANNF